jgi:hypothetical protein
MRKRENDDEMRIWGQGEREQELDGRRREKVQDVPRGQLDDRAHVERMQ